MNFSMTEEQQMLKDSVARFVRDAYSFDDHLAAEAAPTGMKDGAWSMMAELGLLGLPLPEAAGGAGLGTIELLSLAEELGRGLCAEPYLANVVLAGELLAELAPTDDSLGAMIAGERQLALACHERAGGPDPLACATRAERDADQWVLSGEKLCVLNGPNADELLIIARDGGQPGDDTGLGLYRTTPESAGLTRHDYRLLGGGRASDLRLERVPASRIGGEAGPALVRVTETAIAYSCAEALGAMQAVLAQTLEYLKTRKQFGKPLASFQVLQHRMVDMFVEIEQSRSMVLMAMLRLEQDDPDQRALAAAACKAYLHKASKFVAQQGVQLHGGIGVTEELAVGHYFRRLTAFGNLLGDRRYQLGRVSMLERRIAEGSEQARRAA